MTAHSRTAPLWTSLSQNATSRAASPPLASGKAIGDLPQECRFLLNSQRMFLKKDKDPTSKQFDDDEQFRSLTEAQEISADVPEDSVLCDQEAVVPKEVQPIQMGEFLRKYVSRRFFAFSEGEIAALTTAMRQLGVGSQGGTEALAVFHQLIYDECATGSLNEPPARIKVDEKNCIEWKAAGWKHRNLSHVEQEEVCPMPQDRCAEQGDVDSPLECSLALGMVAAAQQASGSLPWIRVDYPTETQRLLAENTQPRCRKSLIFSWVDLKNSLKLMIHVMRYKRTKASPTYGPWMTVTCLPVLVPSCLHEFDDANTKVGAERNPQKTVVETYIEDLDAAPPQWKVDDVRKLATVSTVTAGGTTLGVAVGQTSSELCQDPQTEFALLRESLGVRRINHIMRVHGHTILQEQRAVEIFGEVGQRSLERLFPGFTEYSSEQATPSAGQSGRGYKSA